VPRVPRVRLFVGVEIEERVREAAAIIAGALKDALGSGVNATWIPAGNLHITLAFLGEVDEGHAEHVTRALSPRVREAPFDLVIEGLGAFPPSGAPRVLWLAVIGGGDNLARLNDDVNARLSPIGFPPERRPFSAHLTIARVREIARGASFREVRQMLRTMPAHAGTCHVDAVTLFRSRLSPKGATYEALLRVPLGQE
jgi:2'-5' RNA ligase